MAISMGSFTITDFNDAITLTGYITSNLSKYQIFNPDTGTYTPDYTSQNLVLTPELYLAGTTTNVITSAAVQEVKWYKDNSSTAITTGGVYALSGTKSHILTVKGNILAGVVGATFTCVIKYKDDASGLVLTYKTDISLTRVSSGGGIADALATTPNGNIFKNNDISSLTAECYLWRGSNRDTTNVTYQWYAQDPSVTTDQGGGIGWKKLSNTEGKYSGVTSAVMTVYPAAVLGVQVFKCIIKDTDSASSSYNQSFTDFVSFTDLSDPIQCTIESTGGSAFVNGKGSTTLKARLFQAGEEVDAAGSKYTYKWYKYDSSGTLDPNYGGTGISYKTGKSLSVGDADVNVKATFKCEIE